MVFCFAALTLSVPLSPDDVVQPNLLLDFDLDPVEILPLRSRHRRHFSSALITDTIKTKNHP